jgi:hypothetical protein
MHDPVTSFSPVSDVRQCEAKGLLACLSKRLNCLSALCPRSEMIRVPFWRVSCDACVERQHATDK